MIKDLSINDCIVSLEGVLKIDYSGDRNVAQILQAAKEDLENAYGVTIDKPIYDIQAESQLSATNIDHFLNSLMVALQKLALYNSLVYYTTNVPFSLADVNYLGVAREELMVTLKYLLNEKFYMAEHEKACESFLQIVDSTTVNFVKRLFVILLMLDKLGIYEGATIAAQLLYLGGYE